MHSIFCECGRNRLSKIRAPLIRLVFSYLHLLPLFLLLTLQFWFRLKFLLLLISHSSVVLRLQGGQPAVILISRLIFE